MKYGKIRIEDGNFFCRTHDDELLPCKDTYGHIKEKKE